MDNKENYTAFQKNFLEKKNNEAYYKIKNYLSFLETIKTTIKENRDNEKIVNIFSEKYISSLYVINSYLDRIKPVSVEENNFKNTFKQYINEAKKELGVAYQQGYLVREVLNSGIADYGFEELKKIGKNIPFQKGKEFE